MPVRTNNSGLVLAIQIGLFAGLIGAWEVGARIGVLDTFFFSQPSAFLSRVWTWIGTTEGTILGGRTIYSHIAVTLEEMVAGFTLGSPSSLSPLVPPTARNP